MGQVPSPDEAFLELFSRRQTGKKERKTGTDNLGDKDAEGLKGDDGKSWKTPEEKGKRMENLIARNKGDFHFK